MNIKYNVNVERSDGRFKVTWHDVQARSRDYFTTGSPLSTEEVDDLWQIPKYQRDIGAKLFCFLDGDARHLVRALDGAFSLGARLELYLETCQEVADWPFELLARENSFLLTGDVDLVRRVSRWGEARKREPHDRHLKLLFMSCSALNGGEELEFEKEEEAIFEAVEDLFIDMTVEDSGSLDGLRRRLEREEYDVIHLSGHAGINAEGSPFFIMEDETGHAVNVFPDELWDEALMENPPQLLFLSGCRTGESLETSEEMISFARYMVESRHIPAVLSWGRNVKDGQAIYAGKELFHELSRGKSILHALWRARYELARCLNKWRTKPAWPLLRLFGSGVPLTPLVTKGQKQQPIKPRRMKQVFLRNSKVKVLEDGFVGRRRQLQTALQVLKHDVHKNGVLVLGERGLGKSCLAGKIVERFPNHTVVPIHGNLDAYTLTEALKDAFIIAGDSTGRDILEDDSLKRMEDKIAAICSRSFKQNNYLLLLDGFEQNLENTEAMDLLETLLRYLPASGKMTQLIVSSRTDFSLKRREQDIIAQHLKKMTLPPFSDVEQQKKARMLPHTSAVKSKPLRRSLIRAGRGNPLLMELLEMVTERFTDDRNQLPPLLEEIKNKSDLQVLRILQQELEKNKTTDSDISDSLL